MKVLFLKQDGQLSMNGSVPRMGRIECSQVPGTSQSVMLAKVGISSYPSNILNQKAVPLRSTPSLVAPSLSRSLLAPLPQKWKCQVCGKCLSSKRSYDEHMNIHNDSRPFQCEHCEYAAASNMTLRRHVLRNHTSRRNWGYRCPYCARSYMEPAGYQQHIQSRHLNKSATFGCPYILCNFVSKCFRYFREHLAKHDAIESFAGSPDRHPYTYSDEDLKKYLVDDEYGLGFNSAKRRYSSHPQKTVIFTNDRICKVEQNYLVSSDDFMKEPIKLKPSIPRVARITTKGEFIHDDGPPILEQQQEMFEAGSDWIENEIELPSCELPRLPDGQVELELD